MKKNLIAVSLWMALMPALLQASSGEGNDSLKIGIDLNNVDTLSGIFSGEVSTSETRSLDSIPRVEAQKSSGFDAGVEAVGEAFIVKSVASTPIESDRIRNQEHANDVRASDETLTLITPELNLQSVAIDESAPVMTASEILEDDEGDEAIILENFQKFEMPSQAMNYRDKAGFWAEKSPVAGAQYRYQSRVSASDRQRFEQAWADGIAKGQLSLDEFVTIKGLTAKGEAIYSLLLSSEVEGLNPATYHVGRIENLLNDDIAAHQVELNALIQDGALSYIRDMTMGRPELKKKDRDWLLEGRKVDVVSILIESLGAPDTTAALIAIAPQYSEYKNLKRALAAFKSREAVLEPAVVPKGSTIKPGMAGERVTLMRDRLNYLGYEAGESDLYDPKMVEAVKAFQRTHLLEPDGAAGAKTITELNRSNEERVQQIQINMERWRWMPETMGDHYVVVDIPGFRYSVMKDGREAISARTVVGREGRKTPVFMSPMSYIVFSPYWHVPRSMAVRDFLPRLKKDPYALTRSKIRVFSGGQEVDPGSIDWSLYSANKFPFQLRQDPGDHNSLGRVKFMFPNDHAIYLHDTPSKSLFNRTSRDFSSGCVRIENPEELAEYFLGEAGWDQNRIKSAFKRTSEAHVSLNKDKKIPVYTLYMTTRVEGDSISFRADIYNKDKVLIEALQSLNK